MNTSPISVKPIGDHGILFQLTTETARTHAELLVMWDIPAGTILTANQIEIMLSKFGHVPKFFRKGKVFEFELLIPAGEGLWEIIFILKPTVESLVHIISSNIFEHKICYKIMPAELARAILALYNSDIIIPDTAHYVRFEIGGYPEQTRVLNLPLN